MKVDTDPNTDRPGCLYYGATRITFVGNKMKVLSPNTTSSATPSRCLTVSSRGSEQTKDIPPVIYIKPTTGSCTGVGYPQRISGYNEMISSHTTDYDPCRGTAFVSGNVSGQVTVAADDATTASVKVSRRASAISTLTGRFVAITPPNADSGSHALALR